jgi:potassium-transporting ATPase KdpC subunit
MRILRRQILPAVLITIVLYVLTGLLYPFVVWAVGQVGFNHRANGSFISHNGQVVGSPLIGQNFLDKSGNPDPKYFQPRPSAAGSGYDPTSSGASNLPPGDPRLVGFSPGFNSVDLNGNPSTTNPFATSEDPLCVPTDPKGTPVTSPSQGQQYAKNKDGSYVCDPNTVPERAIAYRKLNGLDAKAEVPVDAVTGSFSGLDPDISVANANLQAPRVAKARNLPTDQLLALVKSHTNKRQVGFLGEETVNVLDLNLALDQLH